MEKSLEEKTLEFDFFFPSGKICLSRVHKAILYFQGHYIYHLFGNLLVRIYSTFFDFSYSKCISKVNVSLTRDSVISMNLIKMLYCQSKSWISRKIAITLKQLILEYLWFIVNSSRPSSGRREKIKLNFYFHTSMWYLERFYEGL